MGQPTRLIPWRVGGGVNPSSDRRRARKGMGRCVCVEEASLALSRTRLKGRASPHDEKVCAHDGAPTEQSVCRGEGTMCVHLHLHRRSPWIQLLKVAKCLVI